MRVCFLNSCKHNHFMTKSLSDFLFIFIILLFTQIFLNIPLVQFAYDKFASGFLHHSEKKMQMLLMHFSMICQTVCPVNILTLKRYPSNELPLLVFLFVLILDIAYSWTRNNLYSSTNFIFYK